MSLDNNPRFFNKSINTTIVVKKYVIFGVICNITKTCIKKKKKKGFPTFI